MEGPILFWGYKEQETNLILYEHDDDKNWKQTRQPHTFNGKFRRVRVTIFADENNEYYIFWVFVCSLSYPAFNAHGQYCHVWHFRPCNIFTPYLKNGTTGKKLIEHENCLDFPHNFFFKTFLFLRGSERDMTTNIYFKVPIILLIF